MDKIAVEILALARMALEDDEKDSGPVEAYGVKGMKSTPWRKTFKSQADFDKWLKKNEGDVEVHGTRKASRVAAAENPLDGMANDQARRNVNQVLAHYTKGVFSDQSWEAVNRIWHALTAAQLDWTMMGNQYYTNDRGVPNAKTWKFEVRFVNKKGRPTILYGTVTAAGAGSVEDPLDRYDLTAYVS